MTAPMLKRSAFQRHNYAVKHNYSAPTVSLRATFDNHVNSTAADAAAECFSDVKLICQGQTFNCHRMILAQKSATFQRMFLSDLSSTEAKNGVVKIDDISAPVLEDLLRFIYCDYVEMDFDDTTAEIEEEFLYTAHKFKVTAFTDLILMALKEKLNPVTACRCLLCADRFQFDQLKAACYRVLHDAATRLIAVKSDEWKMVSARPDLMTELYLFRGTPPPSRCESPVSDAATDGSSESVLDRPRVSYIAPPMHFLFKHGHLFCENDDGDLVLARE